MDGRVGELTQKMSGNPCKMCVTWTSALIALMATLIHGEFELQPRHFCTNVFPCQENSMEPPFTCCTNRAWDSLPLVLELLDFQPM